MQLCPRVICPLFLRALPSQPLLVPILVLLIAHFFEGLGELADGAESYSVAVSALSHVRQCLPEISINMNYYYFAVLPLLADTVTLSALSHGLGRQLLSQNQPRISSSACMCVCVSLP